jgi:hypothetical protein
MSEGKQQEATTPEGTSLSAQMIVPVQENRDSGLPGKSLLSWLLPLPKETKKQGEGDHDLKKQKHAQELDQKDQEHARKMDDIRAQTM